MNEEQPIILPPAKLRLPQIPPQQAEEARRRHLPAKIQQPVSWQNAPQPPIPQTPEYSFPDEQHTTWQGISRTPMPQFFSTIGPQPPQTPPITLQQKIYTRAPHPRYQSIPGRPILRYIPHKAKQKEPGLGESLLGCGVLLAILIVVLALLYYLSLPM